VAFRRSVADDHYNEGNREEKTVQARGDGQVAGPVTPLPGAG
jgi:hypothetical protein